MVFQRVLGICLQQIEQTEKQHVLFEVNNSNSILKLIDVINSNEENKMSTK